MPILFVCWLAFFANEIVTFPPSGYTWRWFGHIFDQNNFVSGFATSLQVGLAAMIGGLLLGVPASLVLGLWFALQFLSNILSSKGGGGVAFRAHIGGFIAGMLLVAVFKRREFRLFNPLRREARSTNWPRR